MASVPPNDAVVGRRSYHLYRRRRTIRSSSLSALLLLFCPLLLLLLLSPPIAHATDFEVGITTLADVEPISRIAYDVRDMAESIGNADYVGARRIYEYGKNSAQYDENGNEMDDLLSLRSMARAGGGTYGEDPSYAFQVLGMADVGESIESVLGRRGAYADDYIWEMLNDPTAGTLGAQATTILVISMYASHVLWRGLLDCIAVKDSGGVVAGGSDLDPRKSFDEFVALYVGAGQTLAPDWDGDMLYELAQAGGGKFGTVDDEGEAGANADVKLRYQEVQRLLAGDDYCTRDDQIESLWKNVHRILSRMYVPMLQMLIHSLKQEDQADKVRMYSLALVPQLSQCRPSIHLKLKEYLLDRDYDRNDFPRILDLLQQSYDCLGISCADVGAYSGDDGEITVAECADYEANHPLAGFIPKEDVRTLSKVDLDILAIDELLKFPSTTDHRMAQLYYKYGKAAVLDESGELYSTMSLRDMIESIDHRKWSPYYSDYVSYFREPAGVFADASMRADETIMAAFNGTGVASNMSPDQRSAYIVSLIRHNVVPEFMMGLLGLALQVCRDADNESPPTLHWDAFAALYIGSMEGITREDSEDDGLMLWSLAANRARNFNTQTDEFTAIINEEMMDLLFAGQSELERRDCANFDKTFSRVLHLLLLPLIQSTIWYAIRNQDAATTDEGMAIGQVMALSVLPIVQKYHPDDASVIERNMIISDGTRPVFEGPQTVANAFYQLFDEMGWGCDYVGQAEGIDACQRDVSKSNAGSAFVPGALILFVGVTSVVVCSCLLGLDHFVGK